MKTLLCVSMISLLAAAPVSAQHDMHAKAAPAPSGPTASGQYAFATISEIAGILKADATTDWSKVNIEALRQHLIDMDDVILRAAVTTRAVAGGLELSITGTGRTAAAIRRMVGSHAHVLDEHSGFKPIVKDIAGGVRLTVTAKDRSNAATVAMIRGLGFAGIMVEGDHHAEHHLMMARGQSMGH
ncbi:MAG: hypothetical protein ABIR92_08125 [Gemmatimonadaceae bacterium]